MLKNLVLSKNNVIKLVKSQSLFLKSLFLENNNIIEISNKTFGNIKSSVKLSLKNNRINEIQDYSFFRSSELGSMYFCEMNIYTP